MAIGSIVQSLSGRDKYRVFMIVGVCDDGRVQIADGKLHKLAFPKKKNLRHLRVLATPSDATTSGDADSFSRELTVSCTNC